MRAIKHLHGDKAPHWVGDGFYVRTLINHLEANPDFNYTHTDPFLLFDYGEPTTFAPNPNYESQPHGVGQHPHKGFETVTLAYSGEISHADSAGGHGVILEGDVQWMTAGRGIMHEEFHSTAFGQRGGVFSMVQLWINLPRAHKLADPKYQTIKRADMPTVELTAHNNIGEQVSIGKAVIIAGDWQGTSGAASTFTSVNLWDIELHVAGSTTLQIPNTHNVMLLVQEGELLINDRWVTAGQLIQFEAPIGGNEQNSPAQNDVTDTIKLTYLPTSNAQSTSASVKLLLLSGEPIGEPVVGYGPFVMTTQEELKQTFRDYQNGNFG
ncbi:pirin family protein [Psychrobacter sp. 72-O-c]|uniref:pirin family protein n=1 Tax=Psychrobacter sp. 72-O-c TaxID=2774125 RepID=UPI00191B7BD2|nr:pirin family protein [Psychrobacter sp. 72-O-c]